MQWPLHFTFSYVQSVTQHLQTKNSIRIVSAINQFTTEIRTIPVYKRTVGKPCIALLQIDTLGCQQKEMGHKGGQRLVHVDACIVRTVVYQKGCLGMEQHQAVKIKPMALAIIELRLPEGRQAGTGTYAGILKRGFHFS